MMVVANLVEVVGKACVQCSTQWDDQREVVEVMKYCIECQPLVYGDVEEVGDLSLESIEDVEVATVDGVFEGAFKALGDKTWFESRSFSRCHGGLWWLKMNEKDDEFEMKNGRQLIV
uniref:Uncharacterized protein n=1 Tax=Tanacetum cinerariifolium TaxID=118510 RepID=A0A699HFF2_TANCI|nr:hypothetical protein [Tanacetum cinerariifolium]